MIWLFLVIGFIVIALIVSFDAVGLTISKTKYYRDNPKKLKSWALLNGFWHAFLLLTYGLFISGFISLFEVNLDAIIALFSEFDEVYILRRIPSVVGFLQEHFIIIAGMIALVVIWQTYQDKITDQPASATRNNLGTLAKYVFDLFEIVIRAFAGSRYTKDEIRIILRSNIEAALVAVDMLALAILANRLEMMDTVPKILGFSAIVFSIVACLCFLAGRWGIRNFVNSDEAVRYRAQASDNENPVEKDNWNFEGKFIDNVTGSYLQKNWWLITLRLLEPWLIFYFALELLSVLLFDEQTHSPGYIFGTSLMLYAVVKSVGLDRVVFAAIADHDPSTTPSGVREAGRSVLEIAIGLITIIIVAPLVFFVAIFFACLVIAITWEVYVVLYQEDKPAFDAMLFFTATCINVMMLGLQFASGRAREVVAKSLDWLEENYFGFVFSLAAIVIAVAVPIVHSLQEGVANNPKLKIFSQEFFVIVVEDMHVHAAQVLVSLLWIFLLSLMLPALRPKKVPGVERGEAVNKTWAELVMVHDKGYILIFPLVLITISMLV
ncbi:MAG: hypothetical protein ABJ364_14830, partial [Lentilitoribacter sp.]